MTMRIVGITLQSLENDKSRNRNYSIDCQKKLDSSGLGIYIEIH